MRTIKAATKLIGIPSAIVDDDLFGWLSTFRWNVTRKRGASDFYYHTRINGKWMKMHTLIIGAARGEMVDHKNHITHDNRRKNLILSNNSLNSHNRRKLHGTSAFKGVYRCGNSWRSNIKVNGRVISVGYFQSEIEAAVAYDVFAKRYFGEHASMNFPLDAVTTIRRAGAKA